MTRPLALLLALLASLPAAAQQVPNPMSRDGVNADLPQAQTNLAIPAAGNPAKFDALCDGRTTEAEVANNTAHDCTAAINSAAQVTLNGATVNVQLQPGRYYIKDTINLLLGQTLLGAGRAKTHLEIRDTFNPAATAIIAMNGDPASGGQMGGIRDLTISFAQAINQTSRANFQPLGTCTSNNAGTGCKYPPAVRTLGGRAHLVNLKIEKAWDGVTGVGIANLRDMQMSAFNIGLGIDGPKDTTYIERFHFWTWGFSSASPIYGVFRDGNTDCMRMGDMDGFAGVNLFCHASNMRFIPSAINLGDAVAADLSNVMLDAGGRFIVEAANNMRVTNMVQSAGSDTYAGAPNCSLTMNTATRTGDRLIITNYWVQNHFDTPICLYAGTLQMTQSRIVGHHDKPSVLLDGGVLVMRHASWASAGATPRTAPVIHQKAGSMILSGHSFGVPIAPGGGVVVQIEDNIGHALTDMNFGGFGISLGCGSTTPGYCFGATPVGFYDLPDYAFSQTVTPTFTGATDFAPANKSTAGQWWLRGNKVEFWLREEFDTNAYTTGNNFVLQTTMPVGASALGSSRTCAAQRFDKVTWTVPPRCAIGDNAGGTASDISFNFPVSGGAITNMVRANMPASTADFLFAISGWYPIR